MLFHVCLLILAPKRIVIYSPTAKQLRRELKNSSAHYYRLTLKEAFFFSNLVLDLIELFKGALN